VVHALLEQRREQERLRGGPESVRELRLGGLSRELGRSEARPELTEQAEKQPARRTGPAPSGAGSAEGGAPAPCGAMGKGP
jgi:hypothetical protein